MGLSQGTQAKQCQASLTVAAMALLSLEGLGDAASPQVCRWHRVKGQEGP